LSLFCFKEVKIWELWSNSSLLPNLFRLTSGWLQHYSLD